MVFARAESLGKRRNMIMSKDEYLITDAPLKALTIFAMPMILGSFFQQVYNMADSIIVGQFVGSSALAAVGACAALTNVFICVALGAGVGAGVLVSRYFGARDYGKMKTIVSTSLINFLVLSILLGIFGFCFSHSMMSLLQTPADILDEAVLYLRVYFVGFPFLFMYNILSTMFTSIGESRIPLVLLIFSSVLNIFLDILFIVPFHMGVAGAAWATILSQFFSAVLSLVVGLKNFPILHLHREDFTDLKDTAILHLKTGFPMGFQMSVMCIGQLAMQAVVNSLGTAAVAGYTAASKADQLSVLVNNAMMTAISNYVAQNFGAGRWDRIRQGVRACLIQTEAFNLIMCIGILLLRHPIVRMFLSDPTKEIYHYSDMYLTIVAPFYFVLGLLAVYRTSIQSMQNGKAPFAACMIELVMRIAATVGLSGIIGYTSVCIASPMAWIGACALLIPVYYKMMKTSKTPAK